MKKVIWIALLSFAITAKSQEKPKSFSFKLEEAVNYALSNNYSAINATRDIASAKSKKMGNYRNGLASN